MDGDDLRMPIDAGHARMDGQVPEQPAERLLRLMVDLLVAEEDHLVFGDGRVQFVHLPVGQRPGEIDAADLGADDAGERAHLDGFVTHASLPKGLSP